MRHKAKFHFNRKAALPYIGIGIFVISGCYFFLEGHPWITGMVAFGVGCVANHYFTVVEYK